jgi:polyhydroxyalkanoate synthesis repressor PhaR
VVFYPPGASEVTMSESRIIKKYPNRRLYDTRTSTYITITDVKQLVLDQEVFKVVDAKSSEDLTRSILLQIILEEESGGKPIFTEMVLSNIIRFYGHAMQGMMGMYLEKNVQAFLDIQERLAEQSKTLMGSGAAKGPGADAWTQFMNFQGPMVQNMMTSYLDQSKDMFLKMQDQFQNQAKTMFPGFPFPGEGGKK